jgi:hypothetical protein
MTTKSESGLDNVSTKQWVHDKKSTGNVATPTGSKFHHIPTTNAYSPHDHRPRL